MPFKHYFQKDKCSFHRGNLKSALYEAFEQCTQIMPTLSAAWENMAVCLANQGISKSEIQSTIIQKAPKDIHDSDYSEDQHPNRFGTLNNGNRFYSHYLQLLQQEQLQEAVDTFNETWKSGHTSDDQAVQFLRGLFIAHEHSAKKQGQLYLPAS